MTSTSYTNEQKAAILLETVKAYYNKGHVIQYDQYAMDRLVRVTPRNTRYAPPEMGNAQHLLFLDCSTFIYTVFYQTFGYQLESNLTWQIPHQLKPCVYEYTLTGEESEEEKLRIQNEILSTLKPGDVFNKVRFSGSGHVVLYAGDGMIYHSRSSIFPDSYQYKTLKDGIYDLGTIHYNSIDTTLDIGGVTPSIFAKDIKSVQIFRPVELMGDPTPAALSRWGKSRDLVFSVLSSHPGGKTARKGDMITYTLLVSNIGSESRNVEVLIQDTPQLKSNGGRTLCSFTVAPGQCVERDFTFCLGAVSSPVCDAPRFIANDIPVWAERVLVSPRIEEERLQAVVTSVAEKETGTLYERIVAAYAEANISLPPTPFRLVFPCFRLIDSSAGDVLWRMPQRPEADLALYSYFGGTGVITPELCADNNIRVQKLWARDFMPGDFILIAEDAEFSKMHCLFFTRNGILQQFAGTEIELISYGEEADKLLDTLPGRFCFITYRPEQLTGKPIDQVNPHGLIKY